ncbi:MAG: V-type ATP synthase subunit D [Candidatus Omnitrophota bacterium]
MPKVKLTKGELKRQRDSLKQFEHYLPFLQLKKQQIQLEIQRLHANLRIKAQEIDTLEGEIAEWSGLLNEKDIDISGFIGKKETRLSSLNVAGVDIPVLEKVGFEEISYDLFFMPLWVDMAIDRIRALTVLLEEEKVFLKQLDILEHELRITTQRVNLFEKIKIPECRENVRLIRIYLGDQQANAVGRSKIAKSKIARLALEEVLL